MIICIPAHNEQNNIGGLVARCKRLYPEAEVVVVDDGSEDFTAMDARLAGATVLPNYPGSEYRDGFERGMRYAMKKDAERIVFMDAGNSYDPVDLKPFVQPSHSTLPHIAYRQLHPGFSAVARKVSELLGGAADYSSMRAFQPDVRWLDLALRCDRKAHLFNPEFAWLLAQHHGYWPVTGVTYHRTSTNLRPWHLPGIALRFALFVLKEKLRAS